VTTANDAGIWTLDNTNTQTLIARIGSGAPGTSANFLTLNDPVLNNNGAVAFRGTLKLPRAQAAAATGIWSTSGGSLQLVAQTGTQAPGYPAGATFSAFTSLGLTDSAGVILLATVTSSRTLGITAANDVGIWQGNSTSDLHLVLRLGQTLSGKTLSALSFLPVETCVNGQTRNFNSVSGDIVCEGTFTDKTTGVLNIFGGTPLVAILSGASADFFISGATFASYNNPVMNTTDYDAFVATLSVGPGGVTAADSVGIWDDTSTGEGHLVARSGTGTAPGTSATFLSFNDPVYNDNEAIAFRATLNLPKSQAATATGLWCDSTGSLTLVAQQGTTQAPGCPDGATFSAFTELALPDQGGATNQGGVIFLATLNANPAAGVTTANNLGIWAVDNTGTLQLIVRTGDILDGKTVTGLAFLPVETYVNGQTRSFAQSTGDLVYLATFSDKSTAIVNVVFP